jgi:hypothetical protein
MQNLQICVLDLVTNDKTVQLLSTRTPDCCIEVNMHSEGPETDQPNCFQWLSSVMEKMLS